MGRERSGRELLDLAGRFPKLLEWEAGRLQPTFRQLEQFARATHVPFGYLFLPTPPEERMPIPDLRTLRHRGLERPSPDLLDTIHAMQRRQAWLREDMLEVDADSLPFVGSVRVTDDPEAVAGEMRRTVGLDDDWARRIPTWQAAIGALRQAIDETGVMAVINGVVGNATQRTLDVEEFRGFALSDPHAPLIFVNGSDARSAQMFTLAHELAHIWLGESAVTDTKATTRPSQPLEQWCDRAAAEFLVPARSLRSAWPELRAEPEPFEATARRFKVSPIAAGRRAMDLGLVSRDLFFDFYDEYTSSERSRRQDSQGGDFYRTQDSRVGRRFALLVVRAAKEGRLSYRDAYDLTGLRGGTFQEYAERLGVG